MRIVILNIHGQLRIVILNEELEEIGAYAFNSYTSLHEIFMPNAAKTIQEWAFNNCSGGHSMDA